MFSFQPATWPSSLNRLVMKRNRSAVPLPFAVQKPVLEEEGGDRLVVEGWRRPWPGGADIAAQGGSGRRRLSPPPPVFVRRVVAGAERNRIPRPDHRRHPSARLIWNALVEAGGSRRGSRRLSFRVPQKSTGSWW